MSLVKSSIYLPIPNSESKLHIKRFKGEGAVVFMVHGVIENGRIFYSKSDQGLAPYLAKHNYDVYVIDLRGRGLSHPAIDKTAQHGQTDSIITELPLALEHIQSLRPGVAQHWIAHSWGGPLLTALLAREPERIKQVCSQTYFGSKRSIKIRSWRRLLYIDLIWRNFCSLLVKKYGYLAAKKFRLGADNESSKSYYQSLDWVYGAYVDSDDQFDYGQALEALSLPPTLFIAAVNDHALGHPDDVKRFMHESGLGKQRYILLSKQAGNKVDYDHIDMLTHPLAVEDHFPSVAEWLKQHQ